VDLVVIATVGLMGEDTLGMMDVGDIFAHAGGIDVAVVHQLFPLWIHLVGEYMVGAPV
jgi:hypothetical protein